MTDRSSTVQELHPPGNRLTLRAQAAELLIQATDPTAAGRGLFELIAAELKLNIFLLHEPNEEGELRLIAHGGLSKAEAVIAEAVDPSRFKGKQAGPVYVTGVQGHDDRALAVLKSIGLRAYYSLPLMAGEQLLGFLGFGRRWADSFDDEDRAFLQHVAHYLALALERTRWEARIRDGEERLRLGMMVAGFGTAEYNPITERILWSPEVLAMYGFPPGHPATVEDVRKALHPDDEARCLAEWQASLTPRGPEALVYEYRVIRPDGAVRWLHVRARVLFAGEGSARQPVRIIAATHDITEAKLAEQRLRESEERLRIGMELAGFGVFELNFERMELILSPELKGIYGYQPEDAVGLEEVVALIHPDDRVDATRSITENRPETESTELSTEFRIIRPDGVLRWMFAKGRMFSASAGPDQARRMVGAVRDITARKLSEQRLREGEQRLRESEQRLQLAQEKGGVASYEWNPATGEAWVSDSYRRIYGLPKDKPVDLETWMSVVHPDDVERAWSKYYEVLRQGGSLEMEYRIIRPADRQERWIWTMCGTSQVPDTSRMRLSGICRDVTERKRNEERERLLSSEVDHRAKNLLSVVQAMVQLTHADSIPDFVDHIKGRIQALGRVHGLLAASRWNGAELSRLIEDELAPFADEDGDRIRTQGPSFALRPAAAQSMALVLHELTTNAAKYGSLSVPDGQVEVRWETGDAAAGWLVLRWRESGGPRVEPPRHLGFGLTHIRGSIERQLGGTLDLQWHAEGLECVLGLPSRQLVQGSV